ncbi:36085_t:CDS:1, partial [Racocetra persica]
GEIRFLIAGKECILKATSVKAIKIGEIEEVGNDKTLFARKYDEECQTN